MKLRDLRFKATKISTNDFRAGILLESRFSYEYTYFGLETILVYLATPARVAELVELKEYGVLF
jgi:hypothetical protein